MSGPDAGKEPSTASSRRRHDVFISYSRQDKEVADAVCAALEAGGIPCWIGPRDTQAGAYGRSIMEAIRSARMLVLILSPHADNTPNVLTEVAEAFDRKLSLLPFRLANFSASDEMRFYIRTQHWIDAFPEPAAQYIPALVNQVKLRLRSAQGARIPEAPAEPLAPSPPVPAQMRKRRGIVWAFTGTAGALGIGVSVSLTLFSSQSSDPGQKDSASTEQSETPPPDGRGEIGPCQFVPAQAGIRDSDSDCHYIERTASVTLSTAAEQSSPSSWNNARSGRSGTFAIIPRDSGGAAGQNCRKFETRVQDPKWEFSATGTACLADNKWRMVTWHGYRRTAKR